MMKNLLNSFYLFLMLNLVYSMSVRINFKPVSIVLRNSVILNTTVPRNIDVSEQTEKLDYMETLTAGSINYNLLYINTIYLWIRSIIYCLIVYIFEGAFSRSFAQTIMHPANTLKTILQLKDPSRTKLTPERLFRGADAQFFLSLPHGALYFFVIEVFLHNFFFQLSFIHL